jgi:hypothetical protein
MGKEKIIPALGKFIGLGTKAAKAGKTKKVVKLSQTVLDKTRESLKAKKLKSGTGTQTGKNTVEWNIPPVKKPVVKKIVVKTPVVKTPVKKVTSKPVVKKPAVKKPAVKKPAVKAPVKAPIVKKPVVKKPIVKTPVKKAPVKKAPVKKAPVVKAPVVKAPVKKPPVKKPKTTEPTPKVKDTSYSGTNTDTRAGKVAAYAGKKADAIGKGVAGVIKAPVKGARYIYRNPKKAVIPAAIAAVIGYGYNQNRKYNALVKLIEGKNKPGNKPGNKPKTIYDNNLMKVDTTGQAAYNKKQKLKPKNNSSLDSTALKKAQATLDRLQLLRNKK